MTATEPDLLESRGFLSRIGVWPAPPKLDIEGWLANFSEEDKGVARALLESLVHINEAEIAHGAISAFVSLSSRREFGEARDRQARWSEFLEQVIVTFPSGSASDATASGHIFARIVRDAGFEESRILAPDDCVTQIVNRQLHVPLVMVDDLSASGTQFRRAWQRKIVVGQQRKSLGDLAATGQVAAAYYLPLVVTTKALDELVRSTPGVTVVSPYVLDEEYFASSPQTRLVPPELRERVPEFLARYAERSGNAADGPYGFGELGLALSFHHAVPNNTLPLLQRRPPAQSSSWRALIS